MDTQDTDARRGHVKMEAATGVVRLQAKEHQGFLATAEAGKRPGTEAPQIYQKKPTLQTP